MLDLSRFHNRIQPVDPITEFGIVDKVVGNTIESHGPNVTMGCVCWLENQGRRIPVEVVGFTDGKVIAMNSVIGGAGAPTLVAIDTATGQATVISADVGLVISARWIPDGKGLLIGHTRGAEARGQFSYISYPGGRVSRITNDLNDYGALSLSVTADGKTLAAVQADRQYGLWLMPAQANATDKAAQIGNARDEGWAVEWTPDGRILTQHELEFVRRSPDGTGRETVLSATHPIEQPAICGRYLVVGQVDVSKAQINLVRFDMDGGASKQLTFGRSNTLPECSPDGRWIAYTSGDSGKNEIFRIPIDG